MKKALYMSSSINTKKKEMKKAERNCLYLKDGGEVHIGDILVKGDKLYVVDEEIIPVLIEQGVLCTKESLSEKKKDVDDIPKDDLAFYVNKVAQRFGWKPAKACNYLNTIDSCYPAAAFAIVLREIAIELDKKYEDHIEKSPEIYVISMLDGRITKANKAHIKNYRNFAAFRSISDAKIACKITKDILKEMFKSGK